MKIENENYRIVNDEKINGKEELVIINNFDFYLTTITIYADGLIDCWGLVDFTTFKSMIQKGKVLVSLPPNSKLYINNIGEAQINSFNSLKSIDDFIKEVEDIIKELNREPGRETICITLFKEYLINNSETNLKRLQLAFKDLPSHKKRLFEELDNKDPLILLMSQNLILSINERKNILWDYFDMNGIEIK